MTASPRKPAAVSAYADACLKALSAERLARHISLGGAFALAFYLEYRETHDIDAWWVPAAGRSAQLEPSCEVSWPGSVLIDSLTDLIAAKMVALVERGAPRDFRDIRALCEAGLSTPAACWRLWRERCRRSGLDTETARASLAVESHLARIEVQRPLSGIETGAERERAASVRSWFRKEFLDGLVD